MSSEGKRLIVLDGNLSVLALELETLTAVLSSGVYTLRIGNDASVETIRFILE